MSNKISEFTKNLRRFATVNKTSVIIIAVELLVMAAAVIWIFGFGPKMGGNQVSNVGTTTGQTTNKGESENQSTATSEETQAEEPTIYPDETIEFQLPEVEPLYSQTDIYTTLDNNIFMDALLYTGYNMEKHRADDMMWKFVPAENKRGLGYLSNISYGDGCSGYETDDNGRPDIETFERGNLVCASFVTYVYFNYLPNVAGVDTSALTRPTHSYSADSFYTAAKDWVEKGYSEYIPFEYHVMGALGSSFIDFTPSREIPLGSLVIFCNPKTSMTSGSHVTVYAGKVNGYDWLYHVGNKNGPEMCAVQRMNFGPNARWPIAIITPPNNVRISPVLEIELVDKAGKPISGSEFVLKHPTSGKEISLGTTDAEGKLVREDLSYGDFELVQIVPEGYSSKTTTHTIKLSGVNNSYNKIHIVNTKLK